jgi:hypothetical protein
MVHESELANTERRKTEGHRSADRIESNDARVPQTSG